MSGMRGQKYNNSNKIKKKPQKTKYYDKSQQEDETEEGYAKAFITVYEGKAARLKTSYSITRRKQPREMPKLWL